MGAMPMSDFKVPLPFWERGFGARVFGLSIDQRLRVLISADDLGRMDAKGNFLSGASVGDIRVSHTGAGSLNIQCCECVEAL